MYKKLTVLLLAGCMVMMMAGCSMFASGGSGDERKGLEGVRISEDFTHEDPADLDFDQRKVLEIPGDSEYFMLIEEQMGLKATSSFVIMYGKEDKPIAYYEYMVLADEKQAEEYSQLLKDAGMENEIDGTLVSFIKQGDQVDADVAQFLAWGSITEGTLEQYAECYAEMLQAVIVE